MQMYLNAHNFLVTENGDRDSFSEDLQDPPGQGPVQPAVGDPASAGGLDWMTHRGPFQLLPFCDSVTTSNMISVFKKAGLPVQ